MKRNVVKIIFVVLLIVLLIYFMPIKSFATASTSSTAINAMQDMADNDSMYNGTGNQKVLNILNAVLGIIQVAGTGISMIMVTWLGIKYLMASASDKADVKKQITPMVIGAIILFGAVNLIGIIADLAETTLSGT